VDLSTRRGPAVQTLHRVHWYARNLDRDRRPADRDDQRHRSFAELLECYFLLEELNAKSALAETNISFSITRSV
jgi:hypothetical protein